VLRIPTGTAREHVPMKAIVCGAGIAGLAAANALARHGW